MAESPPRTGGPKAGDETSDAIDAPPPDQPAGAGMSPMKKRTTVMGLAPAPHLGGLSGSPGAIARAEAAARKQRLLSALVSTTGADAPRSGGSESSRPEGYTTSSSSARNVAMREPAPEVEAEPVDPTEPIHKPKFGTGTLLMTPRDLEPKPDLPSSSEWEAAASSRSRPDVLSEPTMLIEPRPQARSRTPQPPYVAQAQPMLLQHPRASYPPARTTEPPPPTTERILRTAATSLSTPPQPMAPAATALALRPPEYNNAPPHALSGKLDDRLVLLTEPDSPRAVGFRALRDSLLSKSLPRVLAVTSISGREGKTTCAINVALALAEQPGARVLLVDFNFMDPALGAIFAIDRLSPVIGPQPWLGSYYIGAVNNSFHVCAIPPSAVKKNQRFEQHRFDTLIDQLCRGNYDYLVLDTPAMSASPAVSTLVGGADGVLFAVRAGGTTTGRELRRATENLPPKKALGVALIDAK